MIERDETIAHPKCFFFLKKKKNHNFKNRLAYGRFNESKWSIF